MIRVCAQNGFHPFVIKKSSKPVALVENPILSTFLWFKNYNLTGGHEPIRRAEAIDPAVNRFKPRFFRKKEKIANKLTKISNFSAKFWKKAQNGVFFLKN